MLRTPSTAPQSPDGGFGAQIGCWVMLTDAEVTSFALSVAAIVRGGNLYKSATVQSVTAPVELPVLDRLLLDGYQLNPACSDNPPPPGVTWSVFTALNPTLNPVLVTPEIGRASCRERV